MACRHNPVRSNEFRRSPDRVVMQRFAPSCLLSAYFLESADEDRRVSSVLQASARRLSSDPHWTRPRAFSLQGMIGGFPGVLPTRFLALLARRWRSRPGLLSIEACYRSKPRPRSGDPPFSFPTEIARQLATVAGRDSCSASVIPVLRMSTVRITTELPGSRPY